MPHCVMDSPVGALLLTADAHGLCGLTRTNDPPDAAPDDPLLAMAVRQLREYFAGERTVFTVPLHLTGTPFQQACWQALCDIPFGQVRSYAEQAAAIGKPAAVRAVGGANHRNPVWIIVPCHRVIGANGTLTGYGGGLEMKEWLLRHERAI